MSNVSGQDVMTPAILFARIEAVAPSFGAVTKEHLEDNGELLPHLLMADLLRYVGVLLGSSGESLSSQSELHAVLAVLDTAAASGNEETENVVAVSFCEGIESEPFFPQLQPLLGPALCRYIQNQPAAPNAR